MGSGMPEEAEEEEEEEEEEADPFMVDAAAIEELRGIRIPTAIAAVAAPSSSAPPPLPHAASSGPPLSLAPSSTPHIPPSVQAAPPALKKGVFVHLGTTPQPLILATGEAQRAALTAVGHRLVHPAALARPALSSLLSHRLLRLSLSLIPFSPPVLAECLPRILPTHWGPSSSSSSISSSLSPIPWSASADVISGNPAGQWLRSFWSCAGMEAGDRHLARLFGQWALLPVSTSAGQALLHVCHKSVVFFPPVSAAGLSAPGEGNPPSLPLALPSPPSSQPPPHPLATALPPTSSSLQSSSGGALQASEPPENPCPIPSFNGEDGDSFCLAVSEKRARFESIERSMPWLLPCLIHKFGLPVLDSQFLDCPVVQLWEEEEREPLATLVLKKLQELRRIQQLGPGPAPFPLLPLPPDLCDSLFSLFSTLHSQQADRPAAVPESHIALLRTLPIFRNVIGGHVRLTSDEATGAQGSDTWHPCIVPPGAFFQPTSRDCLVPRRGDPAGHWLYRLLGVPELPDHEILVRFALPAFEGLPEEEKGRITSFVLANWRSLRSQESVQSALKATRFVVLGSGQQTNFPPLDERGPDHLRLRVKPSELLDPAHGLLSRVFARCPEKFPGAEFGSREWLEVLKDVGLRSSLDAPMYVECARQLEKEFFKNASGQVQQQQQQRIGEEEADSLFTLQPRQGGAITAGRGGGGGGRSEVEQELWDCATALLRGLLDNLAAVYGSNSCEALGKIRFVPCVRGLPNGTGSADSRTFSSFDTCLLPSDWPLGWTVMPVIASSSLVPPEFTWSAFGVKSPPAPSTLLQHVKNIGAAGESILTRWPHAANTVHGADVSTVESAFLKILRALGSALPSLSRQDITLLRSLPIVPVANGTRLLPPSCLFSRLSRTDLAPFIFPLPAPFLPVSPTLIELGMKEAPSPSDLTEFLGQLKRQLGQQGRLNPNELRSVVAMLKCIHEEAEAGETASAHQQVPGSGSQSVSIVPDDGCRLVDAHSCVFIDAVGAKLLDRINSSRLRFAHPHVPDPLCRAAGVRAVSDAVVERLDDSHRMEMLDEINGVLASDVSRRLSSPSTQSLVWSILRECRQGQPCISKSATCRLLSGAASQLRFVHSLSTRLVLLQSGLDVTAGPLGSSKESSSSRRGTYPLFYADAATCTVVISRPPPSSTISVPSLLAAAVSRLLGATYCLPLSDLFSTREEGEEDLVVQALSLGLPQGLHGTGLVEGEENEEEHEEVVGVPGDARASEWRQQRREAVRAGKPGSLVCPADVALLQCRPLRPFHRGEVVAWKEEGGGGRAQPFFVGEGARRTGGGSTGAGGGAPVDSTAEWANFPSPNGGGDAGTVGGSSAGGVWRYGEVMEDVRAKAGQPLFHVKVLVGLGRVRPLLSSSLLSFRAGSSFSSSTSSSGPLTSTPHSSLSATTPSAAAGTVAIGSRENDDPRALSDSRSHPLRESTPGSSTAESALPAAVPAAELARAVRDMLAAAGMPMDGGQQELLAKSLQLQERLHGADASLARERERVEDLEREAEAAKSSWSCRICLASEVDIVLSPCGHVICHNCATSLRRCPFCRGGVSQALKLYKP